MRKIIFVTLSQEEAEVNLSKNSQAALKITYILYDPDHKKNQCLVRRWNECQPGKDIVVRREKILFINCLLGRSEPGGLLQCALPRIFK